MIPESLKYLVHMAEKWNAILPSDEKDEDTEEADEGIKNLEQNQYSFFRPLYENLKCHIDSWGVYVSPVAKAFLNKNYPLPEVEDKVALDEVKGYFNNIDAAPYDAQFDVICNAINSPVSIVQGPPGTGKTETIINLLRVIHLKYGNTKTVAVVSNNREALNNIHDAFDKSELPVDVEIRNKFAKLGNASVREAWWNEHREELIDGTRYFESQTCSFYHEFLEKYPFFSCTLHSLRRAFYSDDIFDFVIIDESSQTSVTLGFIAIASARHMVALGDNEQLSAIITEKVTEISNEFTKEHFVDSDYTEKPEYNFLAACEKVFEGRIPSAFLNRHYRCHPSIIGFCKENVYKNQELIIMKKAPSDEFRIRAVKYDGNYFCKVKKPYCINPDTTNNYKEAVSSLYGNWNLHQIRVFIEQELPRFLKKNDEYKNNTGKNLSMGVIAPYNAQLNVLKAILELIKDRCAEAKPEQKEEKDKTADDYMKELAEEHFGAYLDTKTELFKVLKERNFHEYFQPVNQNDGEEDEKPGTEDNSLPCFTVHKSQGKGYDYVYFLTTNDNFNEWIQRKRMINVAVSRAKEEFCIVTPERLIPNLSNKIQGKNKKAEDILIDDKSELYISRLLLYVKNNVTGKAKNEGYGFRNDATKPNADFDNIGIVLNAKNGNPLVQQRNDFLAKQLNSLKSEDDTKVFTAFKNNTSKSSPLEISAYHCQYTAANSFLYAVIWDIVLRSFKKYENNNELRALSLNTDFMAEAWSLAYANEYLVNNDQLNISFTGMSSYEKEMCMPCPDNFVADNSSLSEYAQKINEKPNVILFAKIINEDNAQVLNSVIENLLDKDSAVSYLVFSHDEKQVDNDKNGSNGLLGKIHDIVSRKLSSTHDIIYYIDDMLGEDDKINYSIIDTVGNSEKYCLYKFSKLSPEHYNEINKDFAVSGDIIDFCKAHNSFPVTTVNHFAFQIIALVKK